jgi:hypothetical protein
MVCQELQKLPEIAGIGLRGMRGDPSLVGEVNQPVSRFACEVRGGRKRPRRGWRAGVL